MRTQPALFIPHGGGPAFFMQGSMNETFKPMETYLAHSLDRLSEKPPGDLDCDRTLGIRPSGDQWSGQSPLDF